MSFNHVVVWIDHQEAHIIRFDAQASENQIISTHSKHLHLHHKKGASGSGHVALDSGYLHAVITAIKDAKEILIIGPGSAKLELFKHANQHDPQVAKNILGVETVDHPSDAQVLAYGRKYFIKADNMLGDSKIKH